MASEGVTAKGWGGKREGLQGLCYLNPDPSRVPVPSPASLVPH